MSRKLFPNALMVAIVVLLAAHPAPAGYNMLANGSFETGPDPGTGEILLGIGDPGLAPWAVIFRQIFYVGGFWQASDGTRSINLNGAGGLKQPFTTTPGAMHQVAFDLAGDPTLGLQFSKIALFLEPNAIAQSALFTFDTTGKSVTNMGWTRIQWNFWAPAATTYVDFSGVLNTNTALDNVVLAPVSALIRNGSFEAANASLNPPVPPGYSLVPNGSTNLFGWTVGGIGINFVGPSYWNASQGRFSLNLNTNPIIGPGPGSLSQSFTTIPGELYQVSFDLAGDPTGGPAIKTLRVSAAGLSQDFSFDTTGKSVGNMGWVTKNWTFRANATSATLIFQSLDSGANGPALDNVKVVHPANLVLNGSFENGVVLGQGIPLAYGDSTIYGWTVAGNGIDYIGGLWQASEGGRSLDMNALDPGSIEQTFLTTQGVTYRVTFDLAGNPLGSPPVKTLRVSAGGQSQDFTFDTTGKSPTNMGWITKHFTFRAKWETTTLLFESLTSGNAGPALDNVRVIRAPALTPQYLLLLLSD